MSISFPAAAIVVAGVAVLAWLLLGPWFRSRRRRAVARSGLGPAAVAALSRHVPLRARLPEPLRLRFDGRVAAFLAEKEFVGCNGLEVTDEIRAAIAGHACSLLIGRPHGLYESLRSVLVYPTPFWVDEEIHEDDGLVTNRRHVLSGQAWDSSRIILSWEDILETTNHPGSGYNVVVHECAHYFDAEAEPPVGPFEPEGSGVRPQAGDDPGEDVPAADALSWRDALDEEYERLVEAVDDGLETFLDPYAAEDPAEFFAVASEEFVDRPGAFRAAEPRLYALLRAYYGIDPAAWDSAPTPSA
jgi:Mlc titration factor MtfA (ptsG expression regulator)